MSSSQSLARELLTAYDQGKLIVTPCAGNPDFDWNAAYDVAAEVVRLRRARGENPVGRKIGFTNRNIWPEYGATSPIWAHVYDTTLTHATNNKTGLSLRGSVAARIEPEIAFKLRAPVPPGCKTPAVGHPALAVAFLADILAAQPKFEALAAGEVITTGTLTAALAIKAGETWTSEIRGLPVAPLTVTFTD